MTYAATGACCCPHSLQSWGDRVWGRSSRGRNAILAHPPIFLLRWKVKNMQIMQSVTSGQDDPPPGEDRSSGIGLENRILYVGEGLSLEPKRQGRQLDRRPNFRSSPQFGHGCFWNAILPGVRVISSCHVLPQLWHSNVKGRMDTLGCMFFSMTGGARRSFFCSSGCRL
jgi:hypothetical protein